MKHIFIIFTLLFIVSCKGDPSEKAVSKTGDAILDQMTQDIVDKPLKPELYYTRAKYLYEQENFDLALQDMHKAMQIDSINPLYYHLTSDILLDYYQSDNALKAMQKVVALHPKRTASLLKLSELQMILKQYDPSIKTVNEILSYDPQNAEAFFMLGLNFRELGDMPRAINSFQTAVEIDPELVDGWIILGDLYDEEKDLRALDFYNNAVTVAPQNIQALHSKAYYLQNHGKIDQAIELYDQIIELDLHYKEAHLNKGILFIEAKDYDRAFEEFNIICTSHPAYYLGYYYRAIVHQLKGEETAAKNDFQNCLNLNPEFTRAEEALKAFQ